MKTRHALFFALLLLSSLLALASAKTVEEAISEFRFRNDTSADYATATIANKTYHFVRFNGNLSLVLDENADAVSKQGELESLLKTFYENTGKLGFTEATAANINASFSTAFEQFKACNKTFYDHVEDNFMWRDYRCIEINTGRVCDLGFAYRKNLSENFVALKTKVNAINSGWTGMEPAKLIESLTQVRDLSNVLRVDMDSWNPTYEYFRGDWMKDDAACGYDNAHITKVNAYAKDAVAKGFVDVKADAGKLVSEYARRQGAARIKELQNEAKALVEEGLRLVESLDRDFSLTALRQPYDDLKASYEELKNASSLEEAETGYNETQAKLNALKQRKTSLEPVLVPYGAAAATLENASSSVAKTKAKYTKDGVVDKRVLDLEKEYTALRQRLDNTKTEIDLAHYDNATKELNSIKTSATALEARARTLPPAESEIDPLVIATVVVLVLAIAGLVYIFKFRKPPKEVDIRQLQQQREEQHRDAMIPRS